MFFTWSHIQNTWPPAAPEMERDIDIVFGWQEALYNATKDDAAALLDTLRDRERRVLQ